MHISVEFLRSVAAFIVVLGILVFFHELGHYLAARWRGVYVEAFSIGFGRKIVSWKDSRDTEWRLCWLPLGGYVKMHGMERPEDVSAEVRASWMPGRTFHEKSVGSRAIIVAAGPVANFALAIVIFTGLFATAGVPIVEPIVSEVVASSPALSSGIQVGDRIVSIDGQQIGRFEDIQRTVSSRPGREVPVQLTRGGVAQNLTVRIGTIGEGGSATGQLGIRGSQTAYIRLNPLNAIWTGFAQTWDITSQTFAGLVQMISGKRGTEDLGGPLRIAQLSGQVAGLGLISIISFIAVLSVNLGLINLFPIPVLDGGHLIFYVIEALTRRPVPPRAAEYGYRAGFAIIAALFIFATWNDLSHLGIFSWMAKLIG